jgi:hypothetical protein
MTSALTIAAANLDVWPGFVGRQLERRLRIS